VNIHAIAVSAALGDADAIVDNAARLDLDDMPSPLVREMVRELLHRDRARARTHVRALAQRIGLLAAA
jgi:hypothetical protein